MCIVVLMTAKDAGEAEKIVTQLVEAKLIACANIIRGVQSIFWWEGKMDKADEVLVVLKTRKTLFKKVEKMIKSLHSYTVPEIIALPVIEGSKDYLNWIKNSTVKVKPG
ncbi:MAG TPA: cytochrome C biogenesis protein CcdA [Candidatus Omnitrophica bacterium]|nr:MAG: cytochrome C biogenesis protein CcdA [Omnitrophica WOR_2 bacterium GWA2_45_18]OGX18391.1 MAG: cytochrome C biogenesis protein CcdA [Omnitrophica WOR_2 bacterium GWC2_45_7]HBR14868.1 cytochrome C biogenesis protein CcdA [Candidatus Omnitrophota bacterium]